MNRILIVDDEKDNLQALTRLLRGQFAIETTTSPFDALKAVQKELFSVVISDQRMPEMKGVELLEKIKLISPNTTRVLLTGYTDVESIIDAINRGHVYRYIAKPWDPEELKAIIRQADEAFTLRQSVEEKNRELLTMNTQLQQAFADLKRLDEAKHRFLSLISHELNTPLTIISSFVGLLSEKQSVLGEDGVKAVGAITKSTQRLSDIISEVLTYVRLDLDHELAITTVDFTQIVQTAVSDCTALFAAKKIKPVFDSSEAISIRADGTQLTLAIGRLLNETVQRAPIGSPVKIKVEKIDGMAVLKVWRAGDAISLQAFEPLEMSAAVLNHQNNFGLSLALGKMIVEAHGGTVELASDAKTGTTITYRLIAS